MLLKAKIKEKGGEKTMGRIMSELKGVRLLLALLLALLPMMAMSGKALAATTADITVNATPAYVEISCNQSSYDFGVVATSSTTNTSTAYFGIDNNSTVQTDQTISVTTTTWSGGLGWDHSDAGTAGDNTTAIYAHNTDWSIIVKNAAPNYIAENQAATTDYDFGLSLQAPTVLYDGAEKSITVRISASQG